MNWLIQGKVGVLSPQRGYATGVKTGQYGQRIITNSAIIGSDFRELFNKIFKGAVAPTAPPAYVPEPTHLSMAGLRP